MSDIKCPFCHQELKELYCNGICVGLACKNVDCIETKSTLGNKALWQALIQAKQDLAIARKSLREYANESNWCCIEDDRDRVIHTYWYFDCDDGGWVNAQKALEKIEHKDK